MSTASHLFDFVHAAVAQRGHMRKAGGSMRRGAARQSEHHAQPRVHALHCRVLKDRADLHSKQNGLFSPAGLAVILERGSPRARRAI